MTIRKAAMRDIPAMLDLINGFASKGIMLPRTELDLSEHLREFCVAYSGPNPGAALLGCGALHFYSPVVGEVRSLAVSEAAQSRGTGRALVRFLADEACDFGLGAIFAFTYVLPFFEKAGFHEVERGVLPLKAWKDCIHCRKFQCCDEIAVLRVLDDSRWRGYSPLDEAFDGPVLLPVLRS